KETDEKEQMWPNKFKCRSNEIFANVELLRCPSMKEMVEVLYIDQIRLSTVTIILSYCNYYKQWNIKNTVSSLKKCSQKKKKRDGRGHGLCRHEVIIWVPAPGHLAYLSIPENLSIVALECPKAIGSEGQAPILLSLFAIFF
ncbi:tetratricopeptide repeat protein 26, partial [Striga asiatica]